MKEFTRLAFFIVAGCFFSFSLLAKDASELKIHRGEWKQDGAAWKTSGEEPPGGWYLRSLKQYDMESVEFSVKKENENGYIYLYTDDWRVLLKNDKIIVKYAAETEALRKYYRCWQFFWYGLERPITFEAGKWYKLKFVLDGESVKIFWDGNKVVDWKSAEQEWGERIRNCERVGMNDKFTFPESFPKKSLEGKDQIVVLHSYLTPAEFKDIRIDGEATGDAKKFHTASFPIKDNNRYYGDEHLEKIIPQGLVDVNWKPGEEAVKAAESLPSVDAWEIPESDMADLGNYVALSGKGLIIDDVKTPDYYVGKDATQKFPKTLFGPRGLPRKVNIYFNLKDAGVYTFVNDDFSILKGPTPMEIRVDGKPVSRVLYRPVVAKNSFKDYIPLKLAKGPHCITVEFLTSMVNLYSYIMREQAINMGKVALLKGDIQPELEFAVSDSKKPAAGLDLKAPLTGEYTGKDFTLKITGLKPGEEYSLRALFYEIGEREAGKRLMDLYVNGVLKIKDLDVIAESDWRKPLSKDFSVKADSKGDISLTLTGKNNMAFISGITVLDSAQKTVFEKNWAKNSKHLSRRIYCETALTKPVSAEPAKWDATKAFDGHNVIANPHFSINEEKRNKPVAWYSLKDMKEETLADLKEGYFYKIAPKELREAWDEMIYEPNVLRDYNILQGDGEYSFDPNTGRLQPGSLKIGKTGKDFGISANWPTIDFGKEQEFSFWAKSQDSNCEIIAEVYWLTTTMFADKRWRVAGNSLSTPYMALIGKSTGKVVTGPKDWTRVSVKAKPPYNTCFAIPVIRVENNGAGSVWVDDAEIDGYSAEPLELSYSFMGYHPESDKEFVVKSLNKGPVSWELLDKDGKVIKSGSAKEHSYEWFSKRYYSTIDLSSFKTPGTYKLKVVQGNNSFTTEPFEISRDAYRKLSEVALHGLYGMRYNADLPGLLGYALNRSINLRLYAKLPAVLAELLSSRLSGLRSRRASSATASRKTGIISLPSYVNLTSQVK